MSVATYAARRGPTAAFVVSLVVSAVVLFAPEAPGPGLLDVPGADKLVHLSLFTVLGLTTFWRFGRSTHAIAALVLYAPVSEVVQARWITGRGGDVLDAIADVIGIALAMIAWHAWPGSSAGSVAANRSHDEGDLT